MEKTKLTKHELKRQKENLKRYKRFLPTLTAKKQQLQREIVRISSEIEKRASSIDEVKAGMEPWIQLLAEEVGLKSLVSLKGIETTPDNIAGVDIPLFRKADIAVEPYDLMTTPLWVDSAVEAIKKITGLEAEIAVKKVQLEKLRAELLITTQRVNLFEKVKIPEAMGAIRRIAIHLGDMQTAGVVWARMAKKKIEARVR
jgi:V/A-type H+-transporting ATPase subunit D